jgi:haloalkane dehalogenase
MTTWLDRQEYPFDGRYFEMPEGRLHYIDEGSGKPIVMLHGTPDWSFSYRQLIKALRPDYRCIALDNLGFGLSDKPADADYHPKMQAERLTIFLNHLNLAPFTLFVHDFAGPIGLSYAINHPASVSQLIIMNSWLWNLADEPFYRQFSRLMHTPLGKLFYLHLNGSPRFLFKGSFADKSKLLKHIHQHYIKVFPTPESRVALLAYAKALLDADSWYDTLWQNRQRLQHVPTLLIWGMKDIAFGPSALRRLKSVFTNCETLELNHCGHFPHEECSDQVIYATRAFLSRDSST